METIALQEKLIETLSQKGKLTAKDRDGLRRLHQETGKSIADLLVQQKFLGENELLRFFSESLGLPILRLSSYQIDPEVAKLLPREVAERHEVIPVARMGNLLTLAVSRPLDLIERDDLRELTKCTLQLVLSSRTEIQNALTARYTGATPALDQFLQESNGEIELIGQEEGGTTKEEATRAPVVRMVDRIIQEAVQLRASDIHLEPYREKFRIRYRIDGILRDAFTHSMDVYTAVAARIKILSSLDITEKRLPQDGRFKTRLGEREIDFRVSILPTFFGEKCVLRILDKANVRAGLDELGFSEKPIQFFKEAVRRPYGMILVTGPTGSGKSTTLYSVLNLLNSPDRNLMTIEDPIEYQIQGITQTQVNPEIGLTFTNGLRALLRQSPDVILVGEIRDSETADIAVKAALTGHLVLSTLHTNSAAGAVTRLIDMGVEPFLIASSVILVAGQRLLRQICHYCKIPSPVPPEVLQRIQGPSLKISEKAAFKGKGCKRCNETGYLGRLGAIEVMPVETDIRAAVLSRVSSEEIEQMARRKGMETLFESALQLFKSGKTTLQEVLRVTTVVKE